MLTATLVVVFLMQTTYFSLAGYQTKIMKLIHDSPLHQTVQTLYFLTSYAMQYLLFGLFFFQTFIRKPNIVTNMVNIFFICSGFFLTAFIKLLTAELRPMIYSNLANDSPLQVLSCDSNYAMPSARIMTCLMLYYLYKMYLFEKKRHIVLSQDLD